MACVVNAAQANLPTWLQPARPAVHQVSEAWTSLAEGATPMLILPRGMQLAHLCAVGMTGRPGGRAHAVLCWHDAPAGP
eukprot:122987-Chlamydomonas_euryale.AAC.6